MLPKISIITPSYNQAQFIEQTILSVLSQNYPNLEYIIMDNKSTDGTLEILEKYRGKLIYFSQKDRGQSDAINQGIKKSSGEIIGYLNSDDLLKPGSLMEIGEYFRDNPESFWVTGKCHIIDERNRIVYPFITSFKNLWLKYFRNAQTLAILNYISQPATFWRKEVIDKIGFFDEKFYYAMDYDYWLRSIKIYKSDFIDKYLASFRIHKRSKTGKNMDKLFEESYQIVKKHASSPFTCFHKTYGEIIVFLYKIFIK